MARLRPYLREDYCREAGRRLYARCKRVLVLTGFLVGGRGETDGPPGALAIARAIRSLGGEARIVSDGHSAFALMKTADVPVISFPLLDLKGSLRAASDLLEEHCPTAVIAIERCGWDGDFTYHNMRGVDISAVTAMLDPLVEAAEFSIGIGDGGNEIGMGSLAEACRSENVTEWPCVTSVDCPVIAAVSNWGGWGLVAALSLASGRNLLPGEKETEDDLENLVGLGCVDGISGRSEPTVDGWPLEANLAVLRRLHGIVECGGR